MIKEPLTKQDKKHNQQAFYTYAANKTDIVDWRDAYAKTVFERKPYYMIQRSLKGEGKRGK